MTTLKNYPELSRLPTFEARYAYLRLNGSVGKETFGFDRYLNQVFYHSREWKSVRDFVIVRDGGCDLGIPGREIPGNITVHHMNPVSSDDIERREPLLLDPRYLICVSHATHNAIHFGDENLLAKDPIQRFPNDTCPWKQKGGRS